MIKKRTAIAIAVLSCSPCALALNPSLDVKQYAHTPWTIRQGFVKGDIQALAQTPDGYLWLGTGFGLLRFDGIRTVEWHPPKGQNLPSNDIRSLAATRDGSLWIGAARGLARWKDGKLTPYPELRGHIVLNLLEDHDGTVWAAGYSNPTGRLCGIQHGGIHCYGQDGSLGQWVDPLYEDSRGNLWAGSETGLWHWKPGAPKLYPLAHPVPEIININEDEDGALLIFLRDGIRRLTAGEVEASRLPFAGLYCRAVRRDRDGSLWIGTNDRGILHWHEGRIDAFGPDDGLSGNNVSRLLEDREGNIWVSTVNGLDRFHDLAAATIFQRQGLSQGPRSVLAARDGSVWIGTRNGLNRWKDGRITIYRNRRERPVPGAPPVAANRAREIIDGGLPDNESLSLFQDRRGRIWVTTPRGAAYLENDRFHPVRSAPEGYVHDIAEDGAGDLWMSYQNRGLFRLRGESVAERLPWTALGHQDFAFSLLADRLRGGLWLGFAARGGVTYFKDGQVRASYGSRDGLGGGRVTGLQLDGDGALWAATQGGLSRLKDGRAATLNSKNGLPCDTVHWAIQDDAHAFWMYMTCGLVRVDQPEWNAWTIDPKRRIEFTVFDISEGVRSNATNTCCSPRVTKTADGKLWFLPFDGVSIIDPRHFAFNKLPPPVHIEQIIADRKPHEVSSQLHLPPLIRDLEIDYTALSLVAPETTRFRYKLEGHDRDWQEVGNRRQAFYNDLPPRHYRFRVIASNNSGVWNEAGDSLDFFIAPAYYQTPWFRVSCVVVFLVLLWGLYRFRLHQIAQEFAARMGERTRIARELHDSLLQNFQGSLFHMEAARNVLSRRPEQAVQTLDEAISMAEEAIAEGRDAIHDLRSHPPSESDLAQLLTVAGQELARSQEAQGSPVTFRVTVEGERQELDPLLQDEAYRIARELLRNAFRHAQASRIEVDIRYGYDELRLRIRDDGKGIEAEVLNDGGRAGHWGLQGMRERAKRIGAELRFWSAAGAGTEAELSIPSSIAYPAARGGRFQLLRKKKANS